MKTTPAPSTRTREWIEHRLAIAIVVAACALLASAFLIGSTPDEEEFRFTVLTSWLQVRAMTEGRYLLWSSLLGFGVPQPLVANYWLHPLLPLLAVLEPDTWMRLVLLVHTVLGAVGMWRLCRALEIRSLVSAVCAATFLLATPSQNYLLTDFWPSPWIGLTLMPWVLLCARRVLHGSDRRLWTWTALLGLVSGLVVANGNPGNVAVYGVFVPALVIAQRKAVAARWRYLAVAAAVVLAMGAPNAALLARERVLFFASELAPSESLGPVPVAAASWDIFLRPLTSSDAPWHGDLFIRNVRTLFFGGPFAVLALIACVRGGWTRPELAVALAIAAGAMFVASVPSFGASDRYLFRDPIVLCAIPLAGMAADRGLRRAWSCAPTIALLALQVPIVILAALPFLVETWNEGRAGAPNFHGAVAKRPAADALIEWMSEPGPLLFSPQVDDDVRARALVEAGLGVNALAYRGVPVINGWFKGVSADPIWPDERPFYSRIRTPQPLVESDRTLDVLGIRYVLARRDEPVASSLRTRGVLPTARAELVLYENDDAWPAVVLLEEDALALETLLFDGCENDRLLCRDLSLVADRRRHVDLGVLRSDGRINVSFDLLDVPAVLVVGEMYRPRWLASTSGAPLPIERFGNGLLAVRVPAGVDRVRLVYRPWLLITATALAWTAILGCLAVLVTAIAPHRYSERRERTNVSHGETE